LRRLAQAIAGFSAALAAIAPAYSQSETRIQRDGAGWVETVTGSMPVGELTRLRILTRGDVNLRGAATGQISYEYQKRVKARDLSEAKRLLASQEIRLFPQGDWAQVVLHEPGWSLVSGAIRVRVPMELREVVVEARTGNLDLAGLDADVRAETGGGGVHVDQIRGPVVVRTGGGGIRAGRIDGSLRATTGGGSIRVIRSGGEAWLETGGGEIVVEEAVGPIQLSTGAGNVQVARAGSTVSARTLGGLIKVQEARGLVSVESAGGGIQIGSSGSVRCESAAGGIRLIDVFGELRASTARGDVVAQLLKDKRLKDSSLSTNSGDITVLIPSNLAVTVKARNESMIRLNAIISEFPEIRMESRAPQVAVAEGDLNGGGPLLRIAARNGTIYLRRQK
jgi:DUF4097 and DUF4098 domain-containing protein YvlB